MRWIANRFSRFILFVSSVFVTLVPLAVTAADGDAIDWPMFQANGARTGVVDYPPIDKPALAWATQVGIMGYLNCPVIDGDRVFVTSSGDKHNESDPRDGVYCLDLKTGRILWHVRTSTDACGISINDKYVFVGDDSGQLRALSRADGKQAWAMDVEGSAFAQPLVMDNLVIIAGKGEVVACQIEPFEVLWIQEIKGDVRGGVSTDGEQLYVATTFGRVYTLTFKGEVVWQKEMTKQLENMFDIYPAPTVLDGKVYYSFARDTFYDVPALFSYQADGKVNWMNKPGKHYDPKGMHFANLRSSPAAIGASLIYAKAYGNELMWIDRATGKYEKSLKIGAAMFPQWPSPVIASDLIYMARHDGGLYAVDFKTAKEKWMVYLGDPEQAGRTTLPDNILQAAGRDRVRWDPFVGKPIYATPAIAKDGTLVIGTGAGWLYAIREDKP